MGRERTAFCVHAHAKHAQLQQRNNTQTHTRTTTQHNATHNTVKQISVELSNSYVYAALAAFFDRDNVGLPGFAAYFREAR